ncbi:acyl carrier protein [Vibrio tapetis subsp. quintayensis]|uniref:acyl carrier protein n=1 Tax=Vibrio tapetis TaxID=52443 RepID=UPI0025B3F3FD|nr:acyl carrier protein [Vibrio tapetis]MDN3679463.1 acyl carrier protein [Vibrio tapetis subsp. quintayensis]
MSNLAKYNTVFIEALEVTEEQLAELKYLDVEAWDSVGHMGLIAELEEVFEIELDTDDIIDFSSYQVGKDILKKYSVEL